MIHLVVSVGLFHISLRPQKKYNRESGRKRTNKHNMDLGQLQAQERQFFVTILCSYFVHFVDYRGRVFYAKFSIKATRNANSSLSVFPHCLFLLTVLSLDWSVLLSVVDYLSLFSFDNWPLSSLAPFSPRPLPVSRETSSSSPLFGFRAKTDKEIVCLAHTYHRVTL